MDRKIYSVSQVNRYAKGLFEMDVILNSLWVHGEISNLKVHTSGHIYFTLKDSQAAINSVMFASYADMMPFELENGMDVFVCGYVSLYEKTGQYQFYAQIVEPVGNGALNVAFEQLKKKLEAEGLFDADFKRPIKENPNTVVVITSPTGAAVRDVINIISRRNPSVKIVVVPVLVQGESAPDTIVSAIRDVNEWGKADTIILGRGGGSAEDLWPFNSENVARAIFASEIPVISAVGHETDFTIADFVADLRAPTPSAAAELAVSDKGQMAQNVNNLLSRLNLLIDNYINSKIDRNNAVFGPAVLRRIEEKIANGQILNDKAVSAINNYAERKLESCQMEIGMLIQKLELISPMQVLKRGYVLVYNGDMKNIVSSKNIGEGDELNLRFYDGHIPVVVKRRNDING